MFDRDNDDDGENDDDDNNVDDDGDNGENLCWFQAPRYQGLPYLLNSTFIHQYLAFNVSSNDDNFVFVYDGDLTFTKHSTAIRDNHGVNLSNCMIVRDSMNPWALQG